MKNTFTKLAIITFVVMTCGLSTHALAQDNGIYELSNQKQFSTSIGINFIVPLGQKRKHHVEDKARLGFNISLAREYGTRYSAVPLRVKTNLLEMGYRLDGKPNLLLNGQDIYAPLFDPLYANDDEGVDTTTESQNAGSVLALGIIIGGAVVVGAAALATNDIENDIRNVFN